MELPPKKLVNMIQQLRYKEGWSFAVDPAFGMGAIIRVRIQCKDSTGKHVEWRQTRTFSLDYDFRHDPYEEEVRPFYVVHSMPIPPAEYFFDDEKVMRRWLVDYIIAIETHEACEFFKIPGRDGQYYAPFFPHDGDDPIKGVYTVVDKTVDS